MSGDAPSASTIGSIRQRLLQGGEPADLLRVIDFGLLYVLQFDRHLVNLTGEFVRHLVGLGNGRALIGTYVGALVGRERAALGLINMPGGDVLIVDEKRARAALADTAAIIGELEPDDRLSGR